jgi:hypothetical protein
MLLRFPTVENICKALGITISQFFADNGENVILTENQKEVLLQFGALTTEQQQIIKETMRHFNNK